MKHFATAMLVICLGFFSMAMLDIIERQQWTALDLAIGGMITLLIGTGAHSATK